MQAEGWPKFIPIPGMVALRTGRPSKTGYLAIGKRENMDARLPVIHEKYCHPFSCDALGTTSECKCGMGKRRATSCS